MTAPNVEERLAAAAITILSDGQHHSHQAERWARQFLASIGGQNTAFFRKAKRGFARNRALRAMRQGPANWREGYAWAGGGT